MPIPLEPGDRKFLILAGGLVLALFLLGLALAPPAAQPSEGFPSSYSSASDGAKAAFLLLKNLGYRVERWERPPTQLPSEPAGTLFILAEPILAGSEEERHALRAFVRAGGRVLASGRGAARFLPEGGTLDHEPQEFGWKKYAAVVPSALARGASEITMEPRGRWQMSHFSHVGVYAAGKNSVVVTYHHGEGQVIWWAASTPLTNAGISQPGNLNLLLNSLGPGGTRVLWDEYYHGQRRSLWSYFAGTPIPWGLAQLGVLALALLVTFARRCGPVRAPLPESRLSPLEFVETLGDLYHRAGASASAVEISYQRFRYVLARRLGLGATATPTQLHAAVRERLGWKQPGFLETLREAERAARDPALTGAEALRVVQALEHYADLLRLKARGTEEVRTWRNK